MSVQAAGRRSEIEGLRTVAALLVAIYHVWVGRVSGGVDVFFVVTGYFITGIVLKQLAAGRVQPFAYAGRLMRRLVPGAAIVLVAVLGITVVTAPAGLQQRNYEEVIASGLSIENLYLAFNSISYLQADAPPTPAQHFWAMSIQAQFYVLWILLGLAAWLVAKSLRGNARRIYGVLIGIVFVASLVASIWHTSADQPFAYFAPWTRMWEFAIGAFLMLLGSRVKLRGSAAGIASWAGLIVLALTGALLPVQAAFPGVIAAVPAGAAALLLMSTREDEKWWAATRVLSLPPLVFLGSIAFGIYLWHWPLLMLYRYKFGLNGQPGILSGVAIIGAAIVLAYLTKLLLENPVRSIWKLPTGAVARKWLAAGIAGGVVAPLAIAFVLSDGQLQVNDAERVSVGATPTAPPAELSDCYGYYSLHGVPPECVEPLANAPLRPSVDSFNEDFGTAYMCFAWSGAESAAPCDPVGVDDNGVRIAVVGNSHAAMLSQQFGWAAEGQGWSVQQITLIECVWSITGNEDQGCAELLAQQEQLLIGDNPYDVVVLFGGVLEEGDAEVHRSVIRERVQQLLDAGSTVVVIEDHPRLQTDANACLLAGDEATLRNGACDQSIEQAYDFEDLYWQESAEFDDVVRVPTRDLWCSEGTCPVLIGNVIAYYNHNHVSATYLQTAFPELLSRIREQTDALDTE